MTFNTQKGGRMLDNNLTTYIGDCGARFETPIKSGSDHATPKPLFVSIALFDLFGPYLLTLLLIAGCVVSPTILFLLMPPHL